MEKKTIAIIVSLIGLVIFFMIEPLIFPTTEEAFNSDDYSLIRVSSDSQDGLVYDAKTKIVYYYYFDSGNISKAYMCPYYSENGKLCRFNTETKKIEEIN